MTIAVMMMVVVVMPMLVVVSMIMYVFMIMCVLMLVGVVHHIDIQFNYWLEQVQRRTTRDAAVPHMFPHRGWNTPGSPFDNQTDEPAGLSGYVGHLGSTSDDRTNAARAGTNNDDAVHRWHGYAIDASHACAIANVADIGTHRGWRCGRRVDVPMGA